MFRILIVEDEELELNLLKTTVKENFPQFQEIDTANSGDSAMDLLQQIRPDIILMDIHLGNYNGLELSQVIMQELPDVRIIAITAYDQFLYAQQALKIGIVDYLLKPIKTANLLAAIQKQLDYVVEQREKLLEEARLLSNFEKMKDLFSASFTGSIINNLVMDNASDILDSLGIEFHSMCIFVVSYDFEKDCLRSSEQIVLKKIVVDTICESLTDLSFFYDVVSSKDITLCVFYPENSTVSNLEVAIKIRGAVNVKHRLATKVGISQTMTDVAQLGSAYKQALLALKIGCNFINQYSDYLALSQSSTDLSCYLFDLVSSIVKGSEEGIESLFSAIQLDLTSNRAELSSQKNNCMMLWINLIKELESRLSFKGLDDSHEFTRPILEMLHANGLTDLLKILKGGILRLSEYAASIREDNVNYITKRARDYIDNNYAQPMTLNTIATKLNVSPYYLSHLFKAVLDVNVIEYMNHVRISNSKTLLAETELSVKEIAVQTGFVDSNYFCRVFKKNVGITPSEYKKMNK